MTRADLSSLAKSARPGDELATREENVDGTKTLVLYLRKPGIGKALSDFAGYGQTGRASAALWVASALDRFEQETLRDVQNRKTHGSAVDTVKKAISHVQDAGNSGMIVTELSARQLEKIANILVPPKIGDLMDMPDSNPQKVRFQAFCKRVHAEESFNFINAVSAFKAGIGPKGINVAKAEALVQEFIADPDHSKTSDDREKYPPKQEVNLTGDCRTKVLDALRPLNATNFMAAINEADRHIRHMLERDTVQPFLKEDVDAA